MDATDAAAAAEAYLRERHADAVDGVVASAGAVARGWEGDRAFDRSAVVDPMRAELRRRGLLDRFPGLLAGAVEAAGRDLPAAPVAAPPYVVVATTGPVLRATVADGRLVVRFPVFAVDRENGCYVRADGDPLAVAWKR